MNCFYQLGTEGRCKPPVALRQSPGRGPGRDAVEILQFLSLKIFFCSSSFSLGLADVLLQGRKDQFKVKDK